MGSGRFLNLDDASMGWSFLDTLFASRYDRCHRSEYRWMYPTLPSTY